MQSLNRAQIIGHLTRDPELKYTPNGQAVTSFGVATNMVWKDKDGQKQERAEFHNIVAWRKLAEICAEYIKKGRQVYIEGRLQTRDWEGQDGVKRYRTEIVADNVVFLGSRNDASASSASADKPAAKTPKADSKAGESGKKAKGEEEVNIDDIPF